MGTCVSRCSTDPSIHIHSGVLKEKLVVSESSLPLPSILSKKEVNNSSISCSSSSSPCSASVSSPNPSASQLSTSSSSSSSSSHSQTPPAHGSTSNKSSLHLSTKEKTRPAAVDPGVNHDLTVNHQPLKRPVRRPPKQPLARSERKSLTSGDSRRMSSPPKLGRSRSLVNGRPGDVGLLTAKRNESMRSSSGAPGNPSLVRRSSSTGKETCVHQKFQKQLGDRIGNMEASSSQSSMIKEELDNPLVTMDCFIFL